MTHHFSNDERWNIVAECCLRSDLSLQLTRIAISEVSSACGVSATTLQREWKIFKDQRENKIPSQTITLNHVKHAGGSISRLNQVEF